MSKRKHGPPPRPPAALVDVENQDRQVKEKEPVVPRNEEKPRLERVEGHFRILRVVFCEFGTEFNVISTMPRASERMRRGGDERRTHNESVHPLRAVVRVYEVVL